MTYPVTVYNLIWKAVGMFGMGFCFLGYLKCAELEVLLPKPSSKGWATLYFRLRVSSSLSQYWANNYPSLNLLSLPEVF